MQQAAVKIGMLVFLIAVGGCAAHKVAGRWRDNGIVTDGNDRQWPGSPQYYDSDRQLVVRVANNTTTISLCVATSQVDLTRRLLMSGLAVWLDTQGGKKHVFGIYLPGGHHETFAGGPERGASGAGPLDRNTRPPRGELPRLEPLNELAVTYADTTGPLTMTISEVRRTGIDIGVGQTGRGRLVYEFNIAFRAAPSLGGLKPGKVVGIGVLIGGFARDGPDKGPPGGLMGASGFDGGFGGPGPGGRMAGGPGAGVFRKKGKPFEVWLQVRLAGPGAGL